jgi:hypothetical protein
MAKISFLPLRRRTNKYGSAVLNCSLCFMKSTNRWFQNLEDCLRPYRISFSLRNRPLPSSNPYGWRTHTLFNKNQAAWNFVPPAPEVTWRTVAIIIRVVVLSTYLCIRGVSLSSFHHNHA